MKPDIKKYLDIYQYLQDHYKMRKAEQAHFSYEVWAKELNASDKSYVRLMVLGKRHINAKMTEAFVRSLNLSKEEEQYFNYLMQYSQGKTRTVREEMAKKLISFLKSDLDQVEVQNHFEFLSNPLLPRLQVLLSFNDIDQSPKNLAWILGVEAAEIESAFGTLLKLQLIKVENNRFQPEKRSFKVGDSYQDLGLQAFYVRNLEDAKAAIFMPKETRKFKSLFLPLTDKDLVEFWSSVESFAKEQLVKYNPDEYVDRQLYQTHFNIIPVASKSTPKHSFDGKV